jgi:hypothetical protein
MIARKSNRNEVNTGALRKPPSFGVIFANEGPNSRQKISVIAPTFDSGVTSSSRSNGFTVYQKPFACKCQSESCEHETTGMVM